MEIKEIEEIKKRIECIGFINKDTHKLEFDLFELDVLVNYIKAEIERVKKEKPLTLEDIRKLNGPLPLTVKTIEDDTNYIPLSDIKPVLKCYNYWKRQPANTRGNEDMWQAIKTVAERVNNGQTKEME